MKEVFVILVEDREAGYRSLPRFWFSSLEEAQKYIVKIFDAKAVTDIIYKNGHNFYYINKLSKR